MKCLSIFMIISLFFLSGNAFTQENDIEHIQLTTGDVKTFIQSFPSIKKDLEKLDIKYDNENHDFTLPEATEILNEVNAIVTKHGYKDYSDFLVKTATIAVTYASIRLDVESKNAQPDFDEAIKEIQENSYYSPEQKEQMIAMMKQSSQTLETMSEDMADPGNIAVVTPYVDEIEAVLEDD
ncbi:hypothetical protein ES703_95629 [subsurface metagenome]